MSVNVTELQNRIAAIVDQSATAPTAGGTEWNNRLKFLNIANREWAESYQWSVLYKEVNALTSQATGNATVSLPSDFRKFDGAIKICDTANSQHSYPQILPEKKDQYAESDRFFYILGDPNGYSAVISPGSHGSGASIFYSYWAEPASLASPADISECPDPNYLVHKVVSYFWRSRDDGRFTYAEGEAEKVLARMLEFEQVRGHSYDDRIQTYEESRYGFRIGKD